MSDHAALLAECRELGLALAPGDIHPDRFYVRDIRDFAGLPVFGGCLGWAHSKPVTEFAFAERIGDDWRGAGPIIALDFSAIDADAMPGAFRELAFNVFVHELAHIVPPPPPMQDLTPTPELKAFQLEVLALKAKRPEVEPGDEHDCHDMPFARRAIHLWARSAELSCDIPLSRMFGSNSPLVLREEIYLSLLLPEALRMRTWTFEQIEATAAPVAFTETWDADVAFRRKHWK